MTGQMIAQLIIALGPGAIQLIQNLIQNWNTEMTPDQVNAALALASKSYDQYIADAKQVLGAMPGVPPAK